MTDTRSTSREEAGISFQRTFCCQVQTERLATLDAKDVCELLTWYTRHLDPLDIEIHEGNDDGHYTNLLIKTRNASMTWDSIQRGFTIPHKFPSCDFARATIVTVTGDGEWKDYLLLYHYDSNVETDPVPW